MGITIIAPFAQFQSQVPVVTLTLLEPRGASFGTFLDAAAAVTHLTLKLLELTAKPRGKW